MSTFIVNEYIINRKRIGKGSFSTIYKGYSTKNNQVYAIKEIVVDKKQNKSLVKRELSVLKTLDHPSIVKLHDVIIDTSYNNIYFVLDYYPKGDFSKFLDNKPLKEKFCKKYLKQLAEGLEYLLNKDILHRDLKPQNILLTNEYNIKITDFGFAKQIDKNSLINTLCGSPMYMAPEIINKKEYDIKSDLWSVGVILYEMVYGQVPYNVGTFVELIKKINKGNINYHIKNIVVSDSCLELMTSLLTKEPEYRMNWEDFFNHRWFITDLLVQQENNLMEISMSGSLPDVNNYNLNERQFCSFKYESIIESGIKNSIVKNQDKLNETKEEDEIEMNFLESLDDSYKTNNDDESEYESANEEDSFLLKDHSITNDSNFEINKIISEPININKRITEASEFEFIFDNDKKNSNEFEIIYPDDFRPTSLPLNNKTITESFKDYLYSSISLIKQSYNYISSNKSI
jgi:serine/threonine protein kinase